MPEAPSSPASPQLREVWAPQRSQPQRASHAFPRRFEALPWEAEPHPDHQSFADARMRDFLSRCARTAQKEAFGAYREPRSPEEVQLVADKLSWIRSQCGIFDYVPHKKQIFFHYAPCKTRYFQGSNQSGKTTASIVEAIEWAEGCRLHTGRPLIHPITGEIVKPPIRIGYGLDDYSNKVNEVIIPKIKELVPWDVFVKRQHLVQGGAVHKIDCASGSSIKFLSYEQMPKKHEGFTWDVLFYDEPPPRWSFIAGKRGTVKTFGPIHFANTPLSEPWMQEQIVESPATIRVETEDDFRRLDHKKTCMVVVSFPEITHISDQEKEEFEESLTEEEKAARIFGEALHLQGRVFKSYTDKERIITEDDLERIADAIEVPWQTWPWGQIVDPHDRRPYAVAWYVISPRNEIIYVKEHPEGDYYSIRNTENRVDDYYEIFTQIEESLFDCPPTWRRMDPKFGKAPKATSGTTLQEEFEMRGMLFDCSYMDDQEIEVGHHKISKALKDDSIFMLDCCENLHRAFLNYVREDHKRDDGSKPAKEGRAGVKERHKDWIDLVRYSLEGEPYWTDPIVYNARQPDPPKGLGLARRY